MILRALVTRGWEKSIPPGFRLESSLTTTLEAVFDAIKIRSNDPSLPFAEVLAKPIAELDRSRDILLVWPGGKAKPNPANPCQMESDLKLNNAVPVKEMEKNNPAKEKKAS